MCGIVGVIGKEEASPVIFEALRRLEYRGYDSAGIATVEGGQIDRRRVEGKLNNLGDALAASPLPGKIGIGHTRWATHGAPTEQNAHPHVSSHVAVVHNGIIENFRALRNELEAAGHTFSSETDTEVVAHLVTDYLHNGMSHFEAARAAVQRLEGAFALGIIFQGEEDLMVGARHGPPLAIGAGDGEMYLGSDAFALAPMTNRVCYLEDGDCAEIRHDSVTVYDVEGNKVDRPFNVMSASAQLVDKGNHKHFMAKEIYEQPEVLGHTISAYADPLQETIYLGRVPFDLGAIPKITISACGTAFYAGMVAKYWFEQLARVSVEIDVASEFRYREAALPDGGLSIFVSQSGETADTLAALRYCSENNQHVASIVNVVESTIGRESDVVFPIHAGPEIGVASTKAFTCQLMVLAAMAIATAKARGTIDEDTETRLVRALTSVPRLTSETLAVAGQIEAISHELAASRDILFLGRGLQYPIAMEGALKLKEISYIHAEGYAGGELKHGPIALIDDNVPVIVIAPYDRLFDKTISNMQEVIARGAKVLFISDDKGIEQVGDGAWAKIRVPEADPFISPFLYTVPVQLLAYHTAVAKGTDADQPRNLAKSVTVE